jgi:GH18 family chitinase
MSSTNTLRKAGVKLVGRVVLWEQSKNFMRISEKADLRTKMAASIMAAMEKLQLDGFNLEWMWPGCPEVKLKVKVKIMIPRQNIDRQETAHLLSNPTKVTQSISLLPSASL